MKDEKHTPEVGDWLKGREVPPPESTESARQVASRLQQVDQRGRWWPLPWFTRGTRSDEDEHDQDTISGRTRTMISPTKAVAGGAVVAVLGAALLVAQPLAPQTSVPSAEADGVQPPTRFTARFVPSSQVRRSEITREDWGTREYGQCWTPIISDMTDPRLEGKLIYCSNVDVYTGDTEVSWHAVELGASTYRIQNEAGAWQGSGPLHIVDGVFGDSQAIVLTGEGAYEGLYVWMDTGDWGEIEGTVFGGPPPEAPVPPVVE